jgi:hypothetical protein
MADFVPVVDGMATEDMLRVVGLPLAAVVVGAAWLVAEIIICQWIVDICMR